MRVTLCSVEGCDGCVCARGWCSSHYQRWRNYGDPVGGGPLRPRHAAPEERFWSKVDKHGPIPAHSPELGPCWVWTACLNRDGYGRFGAGDGSVRAAYRWAYESLVGPLAPGLEPDHLCRNRACVKAIADEYGPAHLEPVTHRENTLRGESPLARRARQTHCIHGHPFDVTNTYIRSDGSRACRRCAREKNRQRKETL